MKKFILTLSLTILLSAGGAYAMYDFCESPADYYTCPAAYDVRTEYWTDIPDYHTTDIQFKNMKNEKQTKPVFVKESKTDTNGQIEIKKD